MASAEDRRDFLRNATLATAGLLASGGAQAASGQERPGEIIDEPVAQSKPHQEHEYPRDHPGPGGPVGSPTDRGKLVPGFRGADSPPVPVEAPDLTKLPWEIKDGVKEFHLHAEHVRREFLPGMFFDVWGYNGSMPGPTIEAVEGDRVRIVVHNNLPESTTVHWHGIELPNRMDGVHGLTQDPIPPGGMFIYEFDLHQNGTFFYHSHGPMQEGIGMVGLFIIYPRAAYTPVVDRDFALVIQEFAILPMSSVPNTSSMEFNFFTINGRSGPYATPLVVQLGERVRIRFLNFSTIDHHPMHLHGHTFWITGTEGGRIPETAWIPSNNVLVGVAQVSEVEFIANNPGDWMIHCHMFHHMMNHMTSMVGPMEMAMNMNGRSMDGQQKGGHEMHINGGANRRMPAGIDMLPSLGMIVRGPALSDEHGPSLGRGMGEQTGNEREVRNGLRPGEHAGHGNATTTAGQHAGGHSAHAPKSVPGYPQDMMDMHGMYSEADLKKIIKPATRGMRANWYSGVEALMTVIRVLPPDLYEKVMSGQGDIPPGASVPGADPGKMPMHHKH